MENTLSIDNYVAYEYANKLDKIKKSTEREITRDNVFSMQFDSCLQLMNYEVHRVNESTIIVRKIGK